MAPPSVYYESLLSGRNQIRAPDGFLIGRGENLIKLENILPFGLISVQRRKALRLESPLDAQFIARIPQFGQVDGNLSGVRVEITARNQIADVVGVPLLWKLVVKSLNTQGKRIVDANNGLAWKKHPIMFAQELLPVN